MQSFTGKTIWPNQPPPRKDGSAQHIPSQDWSYAVPTPPRTFVPPLDPETFGPGYITHVENGLFNYESSSNANTQFLQQVTRGNFKPRETIIDWKYEERREAQPVLPFLYLGPVAAARDRNFLLSHGITMVLAVRDLSSAMARLLNPKTPHDLGLHVVNIDVQGTSKLISVFPQAIEEINTHLLAQYEKHCNDMHPTIDGSPGRILVFCESGNERSATVAAAYLMAMFSIEAIPAVQVLQAQRFCMAIDDGLRNILLAYGDILTAKRDIARDTAAHSPDPSQLGGKPTTADGTWRRDSPAPQHPASKRTLASFYDDDDAMDIVGTDNSQKDLARFEDREVQAPFTDAFED